VATLRIADSLGRVLRGRYRLIRPLGSGASAHVYVAEDVVLRRRVAIKVLHPGLASDAAFIRRFRAEAQTLGALRHPNILTVYDWGVDEGSPYLVCELLEGGSLRAMLDRGALLSPGQAARVGADAAKALDYAHRRSLVHRDIKPANLIFDEEGRVRVADFGLARALAEASWTEPTGAVVGTARYAAPEQVRGQRLDAKADVYSLALVLLEAVTGEVPFAADTTIATLMARLERPLTAPKETGVLKEILEAAGTIDPAERLDAAGLARALDAVAARLPPPAPLALAGPQERPELDPASLTQLPTESKPFDVEELEAGATPVGAQGADSGPSTLVALDEEPEESGRKPRRRPRVRLAFVAAVVLLVGALGAGGAWAALTGFFVPSHPVPNLVGDSQSQATSALKPLHFRLSVAGRAYSNRYSSGKVISQRPAQGRLKEGSLVEVVLSEGPAPVSVPDVVGKTKAEALAALAAAGLKSGPLGAATSLSVPAGSVISQTPSSGLLLPGTEVSLVISTGKPTVAVPSLSGPTAASFAAAQAALAAVGLEATQTQVYSDTVKAGQVVGTTPGAGTTVTVGSVVTVAVSRGPELFPIPNVAGMSVVGAAQTLDADGFSATFDGNPLATVTGTNPPAGTEVVKGTSVAILTG